jgi:putative NADH-flavin reductase
VANAVEEDQTGHEAKVEWAMKLLVFGATGGTGREIVAQALEQGHAVTAFVRNPAAITTKHERLRLAQGDVLDYPSVEAAVQGQDAVLSALGVRKLRKNTILSDGTKKIIRAMDQHGVKRFVCDSSLGVGDSKGQLGWVFNVFLIPLLLRNVFRDKEVQEQYVKQSNLDWIIVRPGAFIDGPRTGVYRSGFSSTDRTIRGKISRTDVADFMLKQLSDDTYLRKTLGISY